MERFLAMETFLAVVKFVAMVKFLAQKTDQPLRRHSVLFMLNPTPLKVT
jgi:hypothetical protein